MNYRLAQAEVLTKLETARPIQTLIRFVRIFKRRRAAFYSARERVPRFSRLVSLVGLVSVVPCALYAVPCPCTPCRVPVRRGHFPPLRPQQDECLWELERSAGDYSKHPEQTPLWSSPEKDFEGTNPHQSSGQSYPEAFGKPQGEPGPPPKTTEGCCSHLSRHCGKTNRGSQEAPPAIEVNLRRRQSTIDIGSIQERPQGQWFHLHPWFLGLQAQRVYHVRGPLCP